MVRLFEGNFIESLSKVAQKSRNPRRLSRPLSPGKLWLEPFVSGDREIGPVPVPREVSDLCKMGWDIGGMVVKTPKGWRLVEVWNVSP